MSNDLWTASLVEERLAEAAGVLKRLPEEKVQGYSRPGRMWFTTSMNPLAGMIRCCAGLGRHPDLSTGWTRRCNGCNGSSLTLPGSAGFAQRASAGKSSAHGSDCSALRCINAIFLVIV